MGMLVNSFRFQPPPVVDVPVLAMLGDFAAGAYEKDGESFASFAAMGGSNTGTINSDGLSVTGAQIAKISYGAVEHWILAFDLDVIGNSAFQYLANVVAAGGQQLRLTTGGTRVGTGEPITDFSVDYTPNESGGTIIAPTSNLAVGVSGGSLKVCRAGGPVTSLWSALPNRYDGGLELWLGNYNGLSFAYRGRINAFRLYKKASPFTNAEIQAIAAL